MKVVPSGEPTSCGTLTEERLMQLAILLRSPILVCKTATSSDQSTSGVQILCAGLLGKKSSPPPAG